MSKKKILVLGGSILGLAVVLIAAISYFAAYDTLHKERQKILKTPRNYGLNYEDIEFNSAEGFRLKGWWIEGGSDKFIVVAHGYSANRAGWKGTDKEGKDEYLDWLSVAPYLVEAGFSMLYFDFRASGESEGDLITLGKLEASDMIAAINWQLAHKGKKELGLLGFSMGGNAVLRAGIEVRKMLVDGKIDRAAIVSIGPYKYDTMLRKSVAFWTSLPPFFTPLIKQSSKIILGFDPSAEINPENYVEDIFPIPILFIQSEKDEIGDVEDVRRIYEAYPGDKELVIIPNAKRFVHYNYPKNNPEKLTNFYNTAFLNQGIQQGGGE